MMDDRIGLAFAAGFCLGVVVVAGSFWLGYFMQGIFG